MIGGMKSPLTSELQNFARTELETLVKIPSISFPHFDPKEVERSADATADLLKKSGFKNVEILRIRNCFPYVVGDFIVDPELPTALLYAHHDVQPPGREELWKTPPFVPTEINGRLYGRGTADDKAGVLVHAAAMKYFLDSSGKPPINLKVVIEGEEEIGSEHLLEFLNLHRERLKADVIVVTDTGNIQSGVPSITTSLRGMVVFEIVVSSLQAPLHSGIWGGGVVDPVQVLVKMLANLTDDSGNLKLKSISKKKRSMPGKIPISKKEFAMQAGVLKEASVPKNFFQRIFNEPSFSINAIQASSEKLANNIICDRAYARIGIRLTAEENAKKVHKELEAKLKSLAPKTIELKLTGGEPCDAWNIDPHAPKHRWAFHAAERALKEGYQTNPVYIGCGASIPFIAPFEKALKAPVITFGVEDPFTLAHSENESLLLSDFYKTIDSEIKFFQILASEAG